MDGVVREVMYEPHRRAENEAERLGFENVVLQSLRVIEAIVGEPGKEHRFRQHLRDWGRITMSAWASDNGAKRGWETALYGS